MSEFRDRANEIREEGVRQRGNFTPRGVPLRVYKYWASLSTNVPARENFCHFWRVVLFWAPLWFVSEKALNAAYDRRVHVVAAIAAVFGFAAAVLLFNSFALAVGIVALVVVGLLYAGTGLIAGASFHEGDRPLWVKVAVVVSFPTAALGYGLNALVTNWNSTWTDWFLRGLLATGTLFVLFLLVAGTLSAGWIVPVLTVVAALSFIAIIVAGSRVADYLEGKRAIREREFDEQHERYLRGEISYDELYPTRPPGRIAKFFNGVGDFLVLAFQIVRVKKWKICPLVEVD